MNLSFTTQHDNDHHVYNKIYDKNVYYKNVYNIFYDKAYTKVKKWKK